jgi:hypothetical protein
VHDTIETIGVASRATADLANQPWAGNSLDVSTNSSCKTGGTYMESTSSNNISKPQ